MKILGHTDDEGAFSRRHGVVEGLRYKVDEAVGQFHDSLMREPVSRKLPHVWIHVKWSCTEFRLEVVSYHANPNLVTSICTAQQGPAAGTCSVHVEVEKVCEEQKFMPGIF